MRAVIHIDTIEQYDDIRNLADLASISSHPVHNMHEMRKDLYDKPKLVIEGRPTMLNSFIEKVRQMGFRVVIEEGRK